MNPNNEDDKFNHTTEDETDYDEVQSDSADLTVQADNAKKENESKNKLIFGAIAALGVLGVGQAGYSMFMKDDPQPQSQTQASSMQAPSVPKGDKDVVPSTTALQSGTLPAMNGDPNGMGVASITAQAALSPASQALAPALSAGTPQAMNNPLTVQMGSTVATPTAIASQSSIVPAVNTQVAVAPVVPASAAIPDVAVPSTNFAPTEPVKETKKDKKSKKDKKVDNEVKTATECSPAEEKKKASAIHRLTKSGHQVKHSGASKEVKEPNVNGGDDFFKRGNQGGSGEKDDFFKRNSSSKVDNSPKSSYKIVGVLQNRAWLSINDRLYSVTTGDKLPDGSTVSKIDQKQFAVMTSLATIK